MSDTIFGKIIRKEIPADILYENDFVMAFRDIRPQAPTHILIIPKKAIPKAADINPDEDAKYLAEMFRAAKIVAEKEKVLDSGFRLVINNGPDSGQEVYHLHMHLLGGRKMTWPPG